MDPLETPKIKYLSEYLENVMLNPSVLNEEEAFSPLINRLKSTPESLLDYFNQEAVEEAVEEEAEERLTPVFTPRYNKRRIVFSPSDDDQSVKIKTCLKRSSSIFGGIEENTLVHLANEGENHLLHHSSNNSRKSWSRSVFQSPIPSSRSQSEEAFLPIDGLSSSSDNSSTLSNDKPKGRKSPVSDQLENTQETTSSVILHKPMLLLDYEEISKQRQTINFPTGLSINGNQDNVNNFFNTSIVCNGMRSYTKETKYANEQIVSEMEELYETIKSCSDSDFYPSTTNEFGSKGTDAVYVVSVPTDFMGVPQDNPSQSFCDVKISRIVNPSNGDLFTRIIHTVGIDICDRDGLIFKNENNPVPRSIQIVKKSNQNLKSNSSEFTVPYKLQDNILVTSETSPISSTTDSEEFEPMSTC